MTAMALDWGAPPRTGLMAAKDQAIKILAEISQDAPPRGTRRGMTRPYGVLLSFR